MDKYSKLQEKNTLAKFFFFPKVICYSNQISLNSCKCIILSFLFSLSSTL